MTDAAPYRYAKKLAFRRVNSAYDAPILIAFGRDLYKASLGDDKSFFRDFGADGARFPLWIATCAMRPGYASFLMEDNQEIGLIVLGADKNARSVGHIHHLYVAPTHRGQGFGGVLEDYARSTLRRDGYLKAALNVTRTNERAQRFYTALGWIEVSSKRSEKLIFLETDL